MSDNQPKGLDDWYITKFLPTVIVTFSSLIFWLTTTGFFVTNNITIESEIFYRASISFLLISVVSIIQIIFALYFRSIPNNTGKISVNISKIFLFYLIPQIIIGVLFLIFTILAFLDHKYNVNQSYLYLFLIIILIATIITYPWQPYKIRIKIISESIIELLFKTLAIIILPIVGLISLLLKKIFYKVIRKDEWKIKLYLKYYSKLLIDKTNKFIFYICVCLSRLIIHGFFILLIFFIYHVLYNLFTYHVVPLINNVEMKYEYKNNTFEYTASLRGFLFPTLCLEVKNQDQIVNSEDKLLKYLLLNVQIDGEPTKNGRFFTSSCINTNDQIHSDTLLSYELKGSIDMQLLNKHNDTLVCNITNGRFSKSYKGCNVSNSNMDSSDINLFCFSFQECGYYRLAH